MSPRVNGEREGGEERLAATAAGEKCEGPVRGTEWPTPVIYWGRFDGEKGRVNVCVCVCVLIGVHV